MGADCGKKEDVLCFSLKMEACLYAVGDDPVFSRVKIWHCRRERGGNPGVMSLGVPRIYA